MPNEPETWCFFCGRTASQTQLSTSWAGVPACADSEDCWRFGVFRARLHWIFPRVALAGLLATTVGVLLWVLH